MKMPLVGPDFVLGYVLSPVLDAGTSLLVGVVYAAPGCSAISTDQLHLIS